MAGKTSECNSLYLLGKEKFGDYAELVCTSIYNIICSKQLLTYCASCNFCFSVSFSRELQFGLFRSRRAGCVPSEVWRCGTLSLGFWALSFHCGLFPSASCSKSICPPWSSFFIRFLGCEIR